MSARSSNGIKKSKVETLTSVPEEEEEDDSHSIASSESRSSDSESDSGSGSGSIEEVSSEEEGNVKEKVKKPINKLKLKSKSIITKKDDVLVTPKRKAKPKTTTSSSSTNGPLEEPVPLKISVEKTQYDNMHFMLSEIGDGEKSYVRSIVITPENKIQTTEKLKEDEEIKVHQGCVAVFFRDCFSALGVMIIDKKGNAVPYVTKIIPMEYRRKFEMYKITHNQQKGTKKGELGRLYVPLECMQEIVRDMENGSYAKVIKNSETRFEFDTHMKKKWDELVEEDNKVSVKKSKSGNIPKSFVRDRTKSGNIEIQGRLIKDIPMDSQGALISSCNHLINVSVNQPFTDLLKKVKSEIIMFDKSDSSNGTNPEASMPREDTKKKSQVTKKNGEKDSKTDLMEE